jgi:hypothetical protein
VNVDVAVKLIMKGNDDVVMSLESLMGMVGKIGLNDTHSAYFIDLSSITLSNLVSKS